MIVIGGCGGVLLLRGALAWMKCTEKRLVVGEVKLVADGWGCCVVGAVAT